MGLLDLWDMLLDLWDTATGEKTLRNLWEESVMLSNTLIGRDKSMRAWQYFFRGMHGYTQRAVFENLRKLMSLCRKSLRVYKPVKCAKALEHVLENQDMDRFDRALTLTEVFSDGFYAFLDHFPFAERAGLITLTSTQSDNLDRCVEFFWVSEIVPVIIRETRNFFRIKSQLKQLKNKLTRPDTELSNNTMQRKSSSEQLLSPMGQYHSSSMLLEADISGDGSLPARAFARVEFRLLAKQKLNAILLFKAIFLDLPCALYLMRGPAFRNARLPKSVAGMLGFIASLISLHLNWPDLRV